jgi:hypothetical protein
MRTAIFVLAGTCIVGAAYGQALPSLDSQYELSEAKLLELESLPLGIAVTHDSESALATWDGRQNPPIKWYYTTEVSSLSESVTITEFGSFAWYEDQWVFNNVTGKPFTQLDFEKWYSCPGGQLVGEQAFADHSNWSSGCRLAAGKARWYFIGVNELGERVKGEAIIELAADFVAPAE